jgi:1-acyl-sn-glycerol-3-phosphate acyltransferase
MEKISSSQNSKKSRDWYMSMLTPMSLYLASRYDIRIRGLENIPDEPTIFVANHLRVDDSPLSAAILTLHKNKPARLGAKSEYAEGLGIDNNGKFGRSLKLFVDKTHQLPVYREDNIRGAASLSRDIKQTLERKESLILHGEGTRSEDGRMNNFKRGAAAYAIKYGVPLGTISFMYEGPHSWFLREIVEVRFGEALHPPLYGMEMPHIPLIPDRFIEAIGPRVMKLSEKIDRVTAVSEGRVAEMSGQERSGVFLDPYNK